ncbi:hypothetical protein NHQ30_011238 [Ciborinia camelliae]|nr:hypothetical protein NHQ30_011238 [Ciborinia camelliae]
MAESLLASRADASPQKEDAELYASLVMAGNPEIWEISDSDTLDDEQDEILSLGNGKSSESPIPETETGAVRASTQKDCYHAESFSISVHSRSARILKCIHDIQMAAGETSCIPIIVGSDEGKIWISMDFGKSRTPYLQDRVIR